MTADPRTDQAHAARAIGACKSLAELEGYEAEAKRAGIAQHEVTLIAERQRELLKLVRRA